MNLILILLLAAGALSLVFAVAQYNGLVALRNHIDESWSDVDTELQRRHDLIPNLVAVVKGYAAHERAVFEEVAALRRNCLESARTPGALAPREDALERATGRLLAVAENHPALKADSHFLALQHELVETENRVQAARRFYNGNVRDYRNKCELFPSNLVADLFGFRPCDFFQLDSGARTAPRVRVARSDLGGGEIEG